MLGKEPGYPKPQPRQQAKEGKKKGKSQNNKDNTSPKTLQKVQQKQKDNLPQEVVTPTNDRKQSELKETNNNWEPGRAVHPPHFHHAPLHHVELPPTSQLVTIPKKEKFRPIGFVIVPSDSEPKLESTQKITWYQCCLLRGWNSLIFHEIWVSHFCFPLLLTLGIALLFWTYNEWSDHALKFKAYSPVSTGLPSLIAGIVLVLTAILLGIASFRRVGAVVIWCVCLLGLGFLLMALITSLVHINSTSNTVGEFIAEFFHVYDVIGEEEATKMMDHIQRQFKCCGVRGPNEWLAQPYVNPSKNTTSLPRSCCCLPKVKGIKCPWKTCHYTQNKSDIYSLLYHRKGCQEAITSYLQHYITIRWPQLIMTVVALILCLLCSIFYMVRLYARLATHVHPQVRSLVDELVDKADDDVFGFGTGADISEFDDQVRDYIRFNLSQCRTIEEVQEFLTATSDVHHYIRHLEPRDLVRDILSGRPVLLQRFQNKLQNMKTQIDNEEHVDSQQEYNKKYRRQVRARKDLHFLSKRIEHYKSFIDRAQQYHESRVAENTLADPGEAPTPTG